METLCPFTISVASIAIITYIIYIKRLRLKYPPGPWPFPIVGNLPLLSKTPYVDLTRLSKTYGPVFTIWLGWQPTVILNNHMSIKEATVHRGLEFAGRAIETRGFKCLLYDSEDLLMQSYNEKVVIMRELALSLTTRGSSEEWSTQKIIREEVQALTETLTSLNGLVVDLQPVISVPVSNIIARSVLNLRFKNDRDEKYHEWMKLSTEANNAIEKAYLVHFFPILWHILPSVRNAIEGASFSYNRLIERHIKEHKETYRPDTVRDLIDNIIKYQEEHSQAEESRLLTKSNIAGLIRDILGAGTDSVIASIRWCFLVLLHRPDIMKKIHMELDHYAFEKIKEDYNDVEEIQPRRTPKLLLDISDRPNVPYLNAFIHEMMRRCCPGPLAPHKAVVDTSVAGNVIPKDTAVTFNIFASNMDDQLWVDPYDFVPERFLDDCGQFNSSTGRLITPFGAGPRSCIGENLATMEVFMFVANILQSFEVHCSPGEKLPSLNDMRYKLESAPVPYKMIFKLREGKL